MMPKDSKKTFGGSAPVMHLDLVYDSDQKVQCLIRHGDGLPIFAASNTTDPPHQTFKVIRARFVRTHFF